MKVRGWQAWYAHGCTYTSTRISPVELERRYPDGMVGVVEYLDPPYRRIVDGRDWYVWDGSRWDGVGSGEDNGSWPERPEGGVVVIKSAPSLPDECWLEIQRAMTEAREAS